MIEDERAGRAMIEENSKRTQLNMTECLY